MTELLPLMGLDDTTTDIDVEAARYLTRSHLDVATTEDALLGFNSTLGYRFPVTMTEAEARQTFSQLMSDLGAHAQCHLIIDSIPLDVIPTILPQVRDIAEYEVRMWQVRQQLSAPDISERLVALPITE